MKGKWVLAIVYVMAVASISSADTIRGISMDFITIGYAGNAADTRVARDGTTGYGTVGYTYRIGKYEVTNAQWNAFTSAAGAPTGNPGTGYDQSATYTGAQQPTNMVSWLEALQFCNYLTSGDKSQGVYQFSGNNANAGDFLGINRELAKTTYGTTYFLPNENEWYKAAYYKPNGSGYSSYANGLSTIPYPDNGWNYDGGTYSVPWNVGTGTMEQNGTYDMMGNTWELFETVPGGLRGGSYGDDYLDLMSSSRAIYAGYSEFASAGFRVASVPEPATLLLLGLGGLVLRRSKR
jgi:formylglycine-generating enzyme required for sulfatase activity